MVYVLYFTGQIKNGDYQCLLGIMTKEQSFYWSTNMILPYLKKKKIAFCDTSPKQSTRTS